MYLKLYSYSFNIPGGRFFPLDCFKDVFLVRGRGRGGGLWGGVQYGDVISPFDKINGEGSMEELLITSLVSIIFVAFCFDLAGDWCRVECLAVADELIPPLLDPLRSSIALAIF